MVRGGKDENMKIVKVLLRIVLSFSAGAVFAGIWLHRSMNKAYHRMREMSDKHFVLYQLMTEWVRVKQEGKEISECLTKRGYKTIAIYGMNYVGRTLLNEMEGSSVSVVYGIDQNAADIYTEIDVVTPEDELKEVDAIIVTPIYFFDEIREKLEKKTNIPIVSIEDILFEA